MDSFLENQYQPCHSVYQHQSSRNIFLGDITSAVDKTIVETKQIGCVITAAAGMQHVSFDQSINHIRFNVLDSKSQNLSNLFQHFYQLMEQQLKRTNVLVHCFAGISRSATLVISYLMKKHQWSFKEAIGEVRKHRAQVLPNLGFERQLKQYQKTIFLPDTLQRKYISKTSQSKKHTIKKKNLGLPELLGFKPALTRSNMIDNFSDQHKVFPKSNKSNDPNANTKSYKWKKTHEIKLQQKYEYGLGQSTKLIPLQSLRKRSISTKNNNKQVEQNEVYSRHGYRKNLGTVLGKKLNINEIKFGTEKRLRWNDQYDIQF